MPDNVIVAKAEIIERCIKRAREELAARVDFESDYTRQNAALLNLERSCEAAIDIANRMVGFRNLAVHQYQKLDIAIVRSVIERSLDELLAFSAIAPRLRFPN